MAYEVEAMLIAVSVGFVLWFVTQVNVLRTGVAIKADIDLKRAATEKFVDDRLGKVEATVNGLEGRLKAAMPANVEGRMDALETGMKESLSKLDGAIRQALGVLDAELTDLPKRIEMILLARRSVEERALRARVDEAAEGLQEIAEGELAEYVEQGDSFAHEMLAWARKPVDAEYEARSPMGAGLLRIMKGTVAKEAAQARAGMSKPKAGKAKGGSPYGV